MKRSPEDTPTPLLALLVGLFALALYLPHLGDADFVGDDEALDAGVVWQMVERGEWFFPRFNSEYLPPKPPLVSWLAAFSSLAAGEVSEWSVRLPSAAAGAALAAMTVAAGSTLVGRGAAVLAGLMLAVMPVVRAQARIGRADMTMAALVAACLFLAHLSPAPLSRPRRWLFHALLGLALLAKGAVGVGLVAAVVVLDAVLAGRVAVLRSLVDPSLLAFVVIGGSWYLAGALHWGEEFVARHIVGENVRHFFGGLVTGKPATRGLAHRLSHFLNVFTVTLPWGLALPRAARDAWRDLDAERSPHLRFLLGWVGAGLLFFTLASRKSPYYLLPMTPPIALLVGWWAWPRLSAALRAGAPLRPTRLDTALAAVIALYAVVAASLAASLVDVESAAGAILGGIQARPSSAALCLFALFASLAAVGRTCRAPLPFAQRLVAAGIPAWAVVAAALLLLGALDGPRAERQSLRRFALQVRERVPPGEPIAFFLRPLPAVVLYSGREIPTWREGAAPAPEFYLIVADSLADEVPQTWRESAEVVVRTTARVFTRKRNGIELLKVRLGEERQERGREGWTEDRPRPPARGSAFARGGQAAARYGVGPELLRGGVTGFEALSLPRNHRATAQTPRTARIDAQASAGVMSKPTPDAMLGMSATRPIRGTASITIFDTSLGTGESAMFPDAIITHSVVSAN